MAAIYSRMPVVVRLDQAAAWLKGGFENAMALAVGLAATAEALT